MVSLLLNSNPYLYSHKELRQALVGEQVNSVSPVQGIKRAEAKLAAEENVKATYWWRSTPERTGHDQGGTRDKDYVSDWQKPILENVNTKTAPDWAVDETGLYIVSKEPWIVALNTQGDAKWRFRFAVQESEATNFTPVLDDLAVFVSHSKGAVAALDKQNGHLHWKARLAQEILSAPILLNGELWVLVNPLETERKRLEAKEEKPSTGKSKAPAPALPQNRLVRLNSLTGEVIDYSQPFTISGRANLTWAREFKLILISTDNKLYMIGTDDGQLIATQTLPDAIEGPAVVAEGKAFLALSSGKVQAWDISKKGKFEWEIDLVSPPRAAPTYIPTYQLLAVPTADGALHTIDLKKSEASWRLNADNHNPQNDLWASRLSGRYIEKLSMKWEKKGWTIWAPCSDNRICIYNPEKGQLLARISTPGAVASNPVFLGKEMYLITREGKDSYTFKLVHYLDEETFKKKAKDSQKTAETSL